MNRRFLGVVAALAVMAFFLGATVVSMSPVVTGPRHVCAGYVHYRLAHPMSDLHAGAMERWEPRCRIVR